MLESGWTPSLGDPASSQSAAPAEQELDRRRDDLLRILAGYGRVAVALSAGVDSSVVAKAAALACGDRAVAFTANSPSLAAGELAEAQQLAANIGIRHVVLATDEFANADYARNPANRCYFCKTELYSRILSVRVEHPFDVIVNGANLDDCGDHRPGMQAAVERDVRSPLIEGRFHKSDVRELARHWRLPVWDKPAAPCLSSRIAYGVEVTPDRVRRIDAAERWLRETLSARELRVRLEAGDLARIELPLPLVPAAAASPLRENIQAYLADLGFRSVTLDLAGFRSGSLNAALPTADLVRLDSALLAR